MLDLLSVIGKRWKIIVLLTVVATAFAWIVCLLVPKQYLGTVTALPVNSLLADKARIFNRNIEALYTEFGTPDELDRFEGTARLDTIYLAAATDFNLAKHYGIDQAANDALEKAALTLRKNTDVKRTGYGELKIKVWDEDNHMAANLANALMQKLNDIHQQLQTENNRVVLQKLKEEYGLKQTPSNTNHISADSLTGGSSTGITETTAMHTEEFRQYQQMINEYELALKTNPSALLIVEKARPSPWVDKPATGLIVLLTFLASFLFSYLLVLFIESRHPAA